jgi:hypothetical protein
MASMVNVFETDLAELLFQNVTLPNVGDATGIAGGVVGSTQLALASVAYADTDTLLTANEIAYTTYTRPTQARSGAGWTVSGDTASNAALIVFGEMTAGGPDTAAHVGLGFVATGNVLSLHQDLVGDLVINNGVNPQFAIGALDWVFA